MAVKCGRWSGTPGFMHHTTPSEERDGQALSSVSRHDIKCAIDRVAKRGATTECIAAQPPRATSDDARGWESSFAATHCICLIFRPAIYPAPQSAQRERSEHGVLLTLFPQPTTMAPRKELPTPAQVDRICPRPLRRAGFAGCCLCVAPASCPSPRSCSPGPVLCRGPQASPDAKLRQAVPGGFTVHQVPHAPPAAPPTTRPNRPPSIRNRPRAGERRGLIRVVPWLFRCSACHSMDPASCGVSSRPSRRARAPMRTAPIGDEKQALRRPFRKPRRLTIIRLMNRIGLSWGLGRA